MMVSIPWDGELFLNPHSGGGRRQAGDVSIPWDGELFLNPGLVVPYAETI